MLEHISTALCYGWLVIGILFLVVELHMPGFLGFVSCALGCGAAAAGAYFQIALFWQCWIAVGAAGLSFAALWLIFAKPARHEAYRSNVHGLIGKQATSNF
ncbi:hypothetical protein EBZ39_18565 [bacterium]|nr:hypothetical protein [bacterium]